MKNILIGLTVLGSAAAVTAQEASEPKAFFNVAGAYAYLGDFDDAAGFAVNAGTSFSGPHGAEVELAYFDSGVIGDTAEFMPVTAGYRYTGKITASSRFFVSALAGVTWEKASIGPIFGPKIELSDQAFTFGGKIGTQWSINPNWSVDVAYTLLHLQETDIGEGNISYLSASVGYHF